ncbi:MAG: tRNA (N6-isopentenyl adenosine(37)-C2)-methylthiotransferase MiaB [Patescibacteria group bacterium]|nr:tRNA (N6-isopentenyl adenosine(37)-C2)-methylthiotransferase MiaB [Patescibacteria group bacterium]
MKKQKYYIITIGCQMNKSDSERASGILQEKGYGEANDYKQADLVILNTCGVRQTAEDRVYGLIPKIKKENPKAKIILTGCLSKRADVKKRLENNIDIWLPITDLLKLPSKLNLSFSKFNKNNYLNIGPKYNSLFKAFVPIGNGCDNFCSYCVVPHARGREIYRSAGDILNEVRNLARLGYKEITLIAQNVNSYAENDKQKIAGKKNVKFAELLNMVNNIEGNFWIRFATSHPKDMSDKLINVIAKGEKICEHIHLPAQAGDNGVLKAMNRKYTVEHYKNLIKKIRRAIPDASITTDIIVGFPGEARKQFNNTVKLFKEIKFDMAYIARYSSRPGTAAERLKDDVPAEEKKQREEKLMRILRKTALANNRRYAGKVEEILVEGKNKRGEWYGRTRTNKNVKIKNAKSKRILGKFIKVKITNARDFGLVGALME